MSIKIMSKRHLAKIESVIRQAVVFVCYESGRYRLCDSSELVDAVRTYGAAVVETQSNIEGVYRLTVTMGPTYRYQAFFDKAEARRRLPERLFHNGTKHTVTGITVLYGGDSALFGDDEQLTLSAFESRCFAWCMANMADMEELSIQVEFSNGKRQDFVFKLSMTGKGSAMGLADHISQSVAHVHQPDALEHYSARDRMDEYFLLSRFYQYYQL